MYESCHYATSFADYYRIYLLSARRKINIPSILLRVFLTGVLIYLICITVSAGRDIALTPQYLALCFISLYFVIPVLFPKLLAAFRNSRKERKRPERSVSYQFDRIRFEGADSVMEVFYSEIVEIVELKGLYVFFLGNMRFISENKQNLRGGDPEAFGAFLSEKCSLPVRSFPSALAYRKEKNRVSDKE